MRTLSILLALLSLGSACGRAPVVELNGFGSYVESFVVKAAEHGQAVEVTDLRIQFGETVHEHESAYCEVKDPEPPTIIVDERRWNAMDEIERATLIYHELGHCLLRRKHVDDDTEAGIPRSLMTSFRIDRDTYVRNEEYYLGELFSMHHDFARK